MTCFNVCFVADVVSLMGASQIPLVILFFRIFFCCYRFRGWLMILSSRPLATLLPVPRPALSVGDGSSCVVVVPSLSTRQGVTHPLAPAQNKS